MENNNNFFSYNGYINRKNYAINMLILVALYVSVSFVNFESFFQYTNYKFLYTVLMFMVGFFKFVILMSAISVVYRRIADISKKRTEQFFMAMKRLFVLLIVLPALYVYCIRYFFDVVPILVYGLDILTFFGLIPAGIIMAIILCFIKGE